MRDAFKELGIRLEQLPQLHSRLQADIQAERLVMKEEWEDCVSDASANVMKSHLDTISEIVKVIHTKDDSTKEALSTIKHQLERFEETPRSYLFSSALAEQSQNLKDMNRLISQSEPLQDSLKMIHQELSALTVNAPQITVLDMAQIAGTTVGVTLGVANMLLLNMKTNGVQQQVSACESHRAIVWPERFKNITYPFENIYHGPQSLPTQFHKIPHPIPKMVQYLNDTTTFPQSPDRQFFLAADGINSEVLQTDAHLYLCALVKIRPKINKVRQQLQISPSSNQLTKCSVWTDT